MSSSAFISAPTFAGKRPGYVFTSGPQGVGYYHDGAEKAGSSSAAAALDELENFAYSKNKAPPPQDEPPPPAKRQKAPARSSAEALLAEAEADLESSKVEVAQIDENGMKRMVLSIEKRINENMQVRSRAVDRHTALAHGPPPPAPRSCA